MRAVIISDFGSVNGGAAKVAIESARGLAGAGVEIVFACAIGPVSERLLHPLISVEQFAGEEIWQVGSKIAAARQGIWNARAYRFLSELLARQPRHDTLVHLHQWTKAFSPAAIAAAGESGLPVAIDNDATLGALAESMYGAGRDVSDLIYLNGGASGIGGGLVIGGRLVRGAGGYAGELGQNRPGIAQPADRRSGAQGTLEDEVSRSRLLAVVGLHSADEPTLERAIRESRSVEVAAEVERQRRILATALANAVNVLNPSTVVLGGFLATILEQDAEALLSAVRAQAMAMNAEDLQLRPADLGPDRMLVGAAEIAFEALLTDPLTPA